MEDATDSEATMKDEGLKEPADAPKKKSTTPASGAAKKKAAKKAAPRSSTNDYVVEVGDTPWRVAEKLYGEGSRGREIVMKNPGVHWDPGDVLQLP